MMYELSQRFQFDAAHSLERKIDTASSKRIHGHTYHAEITLRGEPDPATGMLVDIGVLCQVVAKVKEQLDHHLLNEVEGLGRPTIENLCAFIARKAGETLPALSSVTIWRSSGDSCKLTLR